jgi:hypothetical protein
MIPYPCWLPSASAVQDQEGRLLHRPHAHTDVIYRWTSYSKSPARPALAPVRTPRPAWGQPEGIPCGTGAGAGGPSGPGPARRLRAGLVHDDPFKPRTPDDAARPGLPGL